jgi:short-subunit dehydrogenase involved in D-alanine esterification of teichoic acids
MPFKYKKVLVVGATSGIGLALAERLVSNGAQVIVTGRRKERLDEFVSKHTADKASAVVFNITNLEKIPQFASGIIEANRDLDCVILNSGIQRGFDFTKPESVDLTLLGTELNTNYLAFLHLTTAFLPHLQKQDKETCLIYTSSGLGLIPNSRCLNYSASKAALHSFVLCLREQLRDGSGNVKVVELVPPAVVTELHDAHNQPDLKEALKFRMPLEQFTDEAWEGFERGDEQIYIGDFCKNAANTWEKERQGTFQMMHKMLKGMNSQK